VIQHDRAGLCLRAGVLYGSIVCSTLSFFSSHDPHLRYFARVGLGALAMRVPLKQ